MKCLLVLLSVVSLTQAAIRVNQRLTSTTLDVLTSTGHSTLVNLIKTANLTGLFDGSSSETYTLFAPLDRALNSDLHQLGLTLAQLKVNASLLADYLSYHVVRGSHPSATFFNDRLFTTLNGGVVRMNHYIHNNYYYIDGSQISSVAYQTQNGMVYTIRHLMDPIKGNLYDTIALDPQLSTLKQAIDVAGLADFLRDQNPITVFAPTNAAFNLLGNATLTSLLGKPDLLKDILTYHVVYGSLYAGGMHDESLHTFEEKDQITLDVSRFGAKIDEARLQSMDISGTNGVIHKISSVLVPADVKDQI